MHYEKLRLEGCMFRDKNIIVADPYDLSV